MKQRVAIFGGSFDPIHLGHVEIAKKARLLAKLDEIIFLPCRRSPHKVGPPEATPAQRVAMIKLATKSLPWSEVSRWEIDRMPPSHSWMAAEHFDSVLPNSELFWILGNDQWENIHRWSRPGRIAELLTFIVFPRERRPMKKAGYRSEFIDFKHPGSSTRARELIAAGQDASQILNKDVVAYIENHGIYASPEPADL